MLSICDAVGEFFADCGFFISHKNNQSVIAIMATELHMGHADNRMLGRVLVEFSGDSRARVIYEFRRRDHGFTTNYQSAAIDNCDFNVNDPLFFDLLWDFLLKNMVRMRKCE